MGTRSADHYSDRNAVEHRRIISEPSTGCWRRIIPRLLATPYSFVAILVSAAVVLAWQGPAVDPAVARKPPQARKPAAAATPDDGVIPLAELSGTSKSSQAADDATERKLQAVVDVDFKNEKLRDVLKSLSRDGKRFRLTINEEAKNADTKPLDTRVTLRLKGFTIDQILGRVLDRSGLMWIVRDGAVQITTPEEGHRVIRNYSLAGLECPEASSQMHRAEARTPHGRSEGSLLPGTEYDWVLDTLQWNNRETWKPTDPTGGSMMLVNSTLIVVTTFHSHREIFEMLRALRLAIAGRLKGGAFDVRHRGYAYHMAARIRRQLAKPATLRLRDVPLRKAVQQIERVLGVQVRLGEILNVNQFDTDTKVSMEPTGASWEDAIQSMLRSIELVFLLEDDSILVTESPCYDAKPTYLFDVRDLMKAGFTANRIEDIIQNQTAGVWRADGDPNGGSLSVNSDFGVVLVTQTRAVNREIAQSLQDLRSHLAKSRKTGGGKLLPSKYINRVETRFYEVGNGAKARELAAAIPVFVEPRAWAVGRFKPAIKVVEGTLIVRQTVKVHHAIREFLRDLDPEPVSSGGLGGLGGGLGNFGGGFF